MTALHLGAIGGSSGSRSRPSSAGSLFTGAPPRSSSRPSSAGSLLAPPPRWRGRIAVSCRMRPPLDSEVAHGVRRAPWVIQDRSIGLGRSHAPRGRPSSAPSGGREFGQRNPNTMTVMDAVFGEHATTREVYERAFRGIVAGAAEGLNGAIIAYGQTASGKTYSMSGGCASIEDHSRGHGTRRKGILHYALEDLFTQLRAKESEACSYSVRMSFCEIYMERVNDLLRDGPSSQHLPVKEDAETRSFYVEGLREKTVHNAEDVIALHAEAERRRRVATTRFNEVSSRSHTLLTIMIEYCSSLTSQAYGGLPGDMTLVGDTPRVTSVGRLVFVDLAGNERVENSADYIAESSSINKSLFFLGKVIERLAGSERRNTESEIAARGEYHLPIRDSNLTRLLSIHLGGNSRTGLLVTVTPSQDSVEESLSTLRFAQKASTIRSVAQPVAPSREQQLILRQQEEIQQLSQQVYELASNGPACRVVQQLREENARLRSSIRYIVSDRTDRNRQPVQPQAHPVDNTASIPVSTAGPASDSARQELHDQRAKELQADSTPRKRSDGAVSAKENTSKPRSAQTESNLLQTLKLWGVGGEESNATSAPSSTSDTIRTRRDTDSSGGDARGSTSSSNGGGGSSSSVAVVALPAPSAALAAPGGQHQQLDAPMAMEPHQGEIDGGVFGTDWEPIVEGSDQRQESGSSLLSRSMPNVVVSGILAGTGNRSSSSPDDFRSGSVGDSLRLTCWSDLCLARPPSCDSPQHGSSSHVAPPISSPRQANSVSPNHGRGIGGSPNHVGGSRGDSLRGLRSNASFGALHAISRPASRASAFFAIRPASAGVAKSRSQPSLGIAEPGHHLGRHMRRKQRDNRRLF